MEKIGMVKIMVDRPVYGEWVKFCDSGTGETWEDRPFKGWQPIEVEVPVFFISEEVGYAFFYNGHYHTPAVVGGVREIENAYQKMRYDKYDRNLKIIKN